MIEFNQSDINKLTQKIVTFIENDSLRIAAEVVDEEIQKRTHKGIDADGKSFKPYSKSYAKVRQAKGLGTTPVNLYVTGAMRRSVEYYTDKTLRPSAGQMNKAEGNQNHRMWFGVNPGDVPIMETRISNAMTREFN